MNKDYDLLVVEDEPVVLSAIKKIVEPEHLRVDEAFDVDTAYVKIRDSSYSLILSDLMLPKRSGFDLLEVIKKEKPELPVIVITGYATLESSLRSFKLGSFDFIAKPFDTEAFLGVVHRALRYGLKARENKSLGSQCVPVSESLGGGGKKNNLYCLGGHAWIKLEADGTVLIGIGETFPNMIENLERLELKTNNEEIIMGTCCARFLTKEGFINMFWAPLSGKVISYNNKLEQNVQLINSTPFSQAWLFRLIPSNLNDELIHLNCCINHTDVK